ncbi:hypothetical protein DRJ04_00270 [Candidatus Aerophobetes bacterium]|uniref:DNA primase DnaB-helicase binding domain-containing protein n=1 Tax=Aerophobetes bacterium TaxID=2030807 RepID=A0A662DNM2_UNCAE|nr:MAG: hypothetical protein DRJ04_00270 [Candidatus Aerophobetes bacterium]
MLLQVMLWYKRVVNVVKEIFSPDDFTHPLCRRLAQEIFSHQGDITPSHLINQVADSALSSLISSLSFGDSSLKGVDLQKVAIEIIQTLKRRSHQRKIKQLSQMIQNYEREGEEEKVKELYQKLIQLRKSILI